MAGACRSPRWRPASPDKSSSVETLKPSEPQLFGVPMKWVSLIMLVAQTVSVVFCMRLSRTNEVAGPRYLNTTAVFFSELMKLVCSFIFLCKEKNSCSSAVSLVRQHVLSNPAEALKVSVPGLLYTVQNNLLFVALSNLSGAVYQVTYQLKILTTAVLSVLILKKSLKLSQWCALWILTLGVTLIQYPRNSGTASVATIDDGSAFLGLAAVLAACVTSGLAGVYLEKILKQSDASIWLRNIQLALFGSILSLAGAFLADGQQIREGGFTQGYSTLVCSVIFLQAVGGLVVAAVLKYADNILKCFGNALSIIISCLLSAVFLYEFEPDVLFVIGTLMVLSATNLYSLGAPEFVLRFFGKSQCMKAATSPKRAEKV